MVLVMLDLESEKGNTLQFVHKALLGEMTICPCLDPAAFPAGDSKKVLKLVLIMGLANPGFDGANKGSMQNKFSVKVGILAQPA